MGAVASKFIILSFAVTFLNSAIPFQSMYTGYSNLHPHATNNSIVALKHIKQKLIDHVLTLWAQNADAPLPSTEVLDGLPIAILGQLDPGDPRSLIGCPNGTAPFDLRSCTAGIVQVAPLQGRCLTSDARYDENRMECVVRAEAQPYILCPEGYRVTLPPHDILKGPCQHSESVPGIPRCDPPYKLSLEYGYCFLRRAQLGYVGCRPGETRKGNECLVALQYPKIVSCPESYTGKLTSTGGECVKNVTYIGSWNIYTQQGVCPPSFQPLVDRSLKKKSLYKHEDAFTPVISRTHDPIRMGPRNVSCIRTLKVPPLNLTCPPHSIDFHKYVREFGNNPPVQSIPIYPSTDVTCVKVNTYALEPVCSSREQQIYIDGVNTVLAQLRESRIQPHKEEKALWKNTTTSVASNRYLSTVVQAVNTLPGMHGLRRMQPRELRRSSRPTKRWPAAFAEPAVMLDAPSWILKPTRNNTMKNPNDPLNFETQLYPELVRTPASTLYNISQQRNSSLNASVPLEPKHFTHQSNDVLLPVQWETLRSMEDVFIILERFNLTSEDVDWQTLDAENKIRIICETLTTAEFYLTCPERFRLRQDGTCIGTGHTNFLVLCPSNFTLDEVDLVQRPIRRPESRCVGNVPAPTTYACAWNDTNNKSFNNPTQSTNHPDPTPVQESTTMSSNSSIRQPPPLTPNAKLHPYSNRVSTDTLDSSSVTSSSLSPFRSLHHDLAQIFSSTVSRMLLGILAKGNEVVAENVSPDTQLKGYTETPRETLRYQEDLWRSNDQPSAEAIPQQRRTNKVENPFAVEAISGPFKDEHARVCYTVVKRRTAWFSPTTETILALYGLAAVTSFIETIARAERLGGSPFYDSLPVYATESE